MTKSSELPCVVLSNINGSGMGHMSTCLAYANRLRGRARPVLFSLVSAIEANHDMGFEADYMVSRFWPRTSSWAWISSWLFDWDSCSNASDRGSCRDALRAACRRLEAVQEALSDRVPVLLTDLATFAFFSRLGWLVEYAPKLSSPADGYAERKQQYLAWRYRDARALPLTVLEGEVTAGEWLLG